VVAVAAHYIKNYQLLTIPRKGFFYGQWLHFTGEIRKHIVYSKPNKPMAPCQHAACGDIFNAITSCKPSPGKAETERQNKFKNCRTAIFSCKVHYK
jgi:hypothetical protein